MTARDVLRRLIIWAMTEPEDEAFQRRIHALVSYIEAWKSERARWAEERGELN